MDKNFSIRNCDGITRIEFVQPPDMDVMYAVARELINDPSGTNKFLWDFSSGHELSPDQLRKIAEDGKEQYEIADKPTRKVCIVAPEDLYYGLSRMFAVYREQDGMELQVFRDSESAVEWLSIES